MNIFVQDKGKSKLESLSFELFLDGNKKMKRSLGAVTGARAGPPHNIRTYNLDVDNFHGDIKV